MTENSAEKKTKSTFHEGQPKARHAGGITALYTDTEQDITPGTSGFRRGRLGVCMFCIFGYITYYLLLLLSRFLIISYIRTTEITAPVNASAQSGAPVLFWPI